MHTYTFALEEKKNQIWGKSAGLCILNEDLKLPCCWSVSLWEELHRQGAAVAAGAGRIAPQVFPGTTSSVATRQISVFSILWQSLEMRRLRPHLRHSKSNLTL